RWLCVPRLRRRPSLGVAHQAVDLGVRRLPSADLGDRQHHHAPLQAAADHLVLGGLSDGDPFQRHLGAATATPARSRLLQVGLADLRQAAPQHGAVRGVNLIMDRLNLTWDKVFAGIVDNIKEELASEKPEAMTTDDALAKFVRGYQARMVS